MDMGLLVWRRIVQETVPALQLLELLYFCCSTMITMIHISNTRPTCMLYVSLYYMWYDYKLLKTSQYDYTVLLLYDYYNVLDEEN